MLFTESVVGRQLFFCLSFEEIGRLLGFESTLLEGIGALLEAAWLSGTKLVGNCEGQASFFLHPRGLFRNTN